jgi:hypothetical protein
VYGSGVCVEFWICGVVMAVVAIIENGKWVPVTDGHQQHAVTVNTPMDAIVDHLAAVVKQAQSLSDHDQRRTRDFVRAALATLEATTSLPKSDQRMFERSLRGD